MQEMTLNIFSLEFYTATVVLILAIIVVFMLLRFAAIIRTLEDTQELLFKLLGITEPRSLLELDLPPELSAAEGGERQN